MPSDATLQDGCAATFQRRWRHLANPDVRNLAWLLDAPGMLNPLHELWHGQIAQLGPVDARCMAWLAELDRQPQALTAFLSVHPHTRLGHYAEKLLAWYFSWAGVLQAHSLQIRTHTTIGEFDFLLNLPGGLEHWEFACKFYLRVEPSAKAAAPPDPLALMVGPNLMDNLFDKSRKIMHQQLALGRHPAGLASLPAQLGAARMLIKGWLFYPPGDGDCLAALHPAHCRGIWVRAGDLQRIADQHQYAILPRLRWLAPARFADDVEKMTLPAMADRLQRQFTTDVRPVLIVSLLPDQDAWVEQTRIFVVPDDWNC